MSRRLDNLFPRLPALHAAQRVDRVEAACLAGGGETEHDAHQHRKAHAQRDGAQRYGEAHVDGQSHQQGNEQPDDLLGRQIVVYLIALSIFASPSAAC